ncbi:unnamed protein product [Absidia cylindrospora]
MSLTNDYYDSIDINVRWSDRQDLILTLSPTDTLQTVKEKIKQSSVHIENKYLRLIHNGRVLDDRKTLLDYDIGKLPAGVNSKQKMAPPAPVFIHCSLSDYKPEKKATNNQPQLTTPIGFDRLREAGFSEEDVRNIRTQFHRMNGTPHTGNESSEQAMHLEEQWMDNTGETLPDGTAQGTYKEMMWGLMLGFFLGIICLFWFRESIFTRRHQMGIVAGILINISFGLLHVYY